MDEIEFPEGEELEVMTGISPECQQNKCEACPGMTMQGNKPMFCVHSCHRVDVSA